MFIKIIQLVRICLGCLFILLGSLGIFFGIIEILDPVGSKMADDSDPLGVPRTITETLTLTLTYAAVFVVGVFLLGSKWLREQFSKINLK